MKLNNIFNWQWWNVLFVLRFMTEIAAFPTAVFINQLSIKAPSLPISTSVFIQRSTMSSTWKIVCFILLGSVLIDNSSAQIFSKYGIVMDEKIENCASPEEDAKVLDLSNFEFIAETDMDVFINGSIKIMRKIEDKVDHRIYAEKFERGQWLMSAVNIKRESFCKSFRDPAEIWYSKTKRLKGCPLEIGVKIDNLIIQNH
jgi:hypothetical protein